METLHTVGKRKTARARVFINEGKGNIVINGKKAEEYFPLDRYQYVIRQPLTILGVEDQYDVTVTITGGGITGQAEAVRHGIARALAELLPDRRVELKRAGFLTRDPREVERKKPGQPKARKQYQYRKR